MAASKSDYKRGEMEINAQKGTFSGFMAGTVYGGAAIIVGLLFPILVYGVNLSWAPALITSIVVGILIGIGLKLKGAWYASLIGLGILAAIICAVVPPLFGAIF